MARDISQKQKLPVEKNIGEKTIEENRRERKGENKRR